MRTGFRGGFDVKVLINFGPAFVESFTLAAESGGVLYDAGGSLYDTSLYSLSNFQDTQDFPLNDVVNSVSLVFTATTSLSSSGLAILGTGAPPEIGAWGVYSVGFSYRPLGLG